MKTIIIAWKGIRHNLTIVLLALLFINLTLDSTSQTIQKETITIDLAKTPKKKDICLSEISKGIHYIPLETRKDLAIGYCSVNPAGSNFIIHQEGYTLVYF